MKPTKQQRPLAVFDIDGTVFRSSLFIELVEELIRASVFPRSARKEFRDEELAWKERRGDYESYLSAVIQVFNTHLQGVHYGDFADVAETLIQDQQYHVYRHTRDLIQYLREQQYFLVAISGSPKTVIDKFVRAFGFDKAYGRLYELGPSDRFTGAVIDEHRIANKANIVRRVLSREAATLEGSVGVGDTEVDIPFLELMETPICFNPNSELYRYARRLGWRVAVERKDVVYPIQGPLFTPDI